MTREKFTTVILWCLVCIPFLIIITAWIVRLILLGDPSNPVNGLQLDTI